MVERVALGTAQFGLRYGVANTAGQVSESDAKSIVGRARKAGLDTLDTAIAYGDSEERLGLIGVTSWKVVTKLPPLPAGRADVVTWVEAAARGSIRRLGVSNLYGLLLHSPEDLLRACGDDLFRGLIGAREKGLMQKIGISVYHPEQIDSVLRKFGVDLVQAPFSVVDRRLQTSGWLSKLKQRGVEVHTRSALLQGLLAMPAANRPPRFSRWKALWEKWDKWLSYSGLTPIQACIGFALSEPAVDRVVVGVDNTGQLDQIVAATETAGVDAPADLASDDVELIDPSRWN